MLSCEVAVCLFPNVNWSLLDYSGHCLCLFFASSCPASPWAGAGAALDPLLSLSPSVAAQERSMEKSWYEVIISSVLLANGNRKE